MRIYLAANEEEANNYVAKVLKNALGQFVATGKKDPTLVIVETREASSEVCTLTGVVAVTGKTFTDLMKEVTDPWDCAITVEPPQLLSSVGVLTGIVSEADEFGGRDFTHRWHALLVEGTPTRILRGSDDGLNPTFTHLGLRLDQYAKLATHNHLFRCLEFAPKLGQELSHNFETAFDLLLELTRDFNPAELLALQTLMSPAQAHNWLTQPHQSLPRLCAAARTTIKT